MVASGVDKARTGIICLLYVVVWYVEGLFSHVIVVVGSLRTAAAV